MADRFELEVVTLPNGNSVAAYIDLVDERHDADSQKQVIVDLSELGFTPRELIFDVGVQNEIIGVEIL